MKAKLAAVLVTVLVTVLVSASVGACASASTGTPKAQAPSTKTTLRPVAGTFDTVTVTRGNEVLHVAVLTADRCEELRANVPAVEVPCTASKPAAGVEVVLNAAEHRDNLGITAPDGTLDVPLSRIDALFQQRLVNNPGQRAQLLVHGNVVSDLPLGEILNRQSVIDSTIADCDRVLAQPSVAHEVVQRVLNTLLDLQVRGIADPRIAERTHQLSERLRASETKPDVQQQELGHAQELLTQLKETGGEQTVPEDVQHSLREKIVESESFKWAVSMLPTMCKITVKGGGVAAGQLIATGAPGIALSIIAASVGDDLQRWLIERCCKLATESFGGANSCSDNSNKTARLP